MRGSPVNAFEYLKKTGLEGKVVIVTGGARGIGLGIVKRFCAEGCRVIIADIKTSAGGAVAEELQHAGCLVTFMELDVTDEAAANSMADAVVELYGRIDILVNNAGITADGRSVTVDKETGEVTVMSYERWSQVLHVNLDGAFICSQAVLRHMLPLQSGCVLFMSSVVAVHGGYGQVNYVTSKKALIGLAETYTIEHGPAGIRVCVVSPGYTGTEMVLTVPEKVLDKIRARTPMRRLATIEEIANGIVWLAGDQASFVNGIVLRIDGGLKP